MNRRICLLCMILWAAPLTAVGQSPTTSSSPAASPKTAVEPKQELTTAEKIVRSEKAIADAETQIADLRQQLDDPESEFAQAKAEFTELDEKLTGLQKDLTRLQGEGEQAGVEEVQRQIEDVKPQRDLAKERFDLAIKEQNALNEKIATLEKRLSQEKEAMAKLQAGPNGEVAPPSPAPTSAGSEQPTPGESGPQTPAPSPTASQTPVATTVPQQTEPASPAPAASGEAAPASPGPTKKPSKEVVEAQKVAEEKSVQAQQAHEEVKSVEERLQTLKEELAAETKLLQTAREKVQNAADVQTQTRETLATKRGENAPRNEIRDLEEKFSQAKKREEEAKAEVDQHNDRIQELEDALAALQEEVDIAAQKAEVKQQEADKAVEKLEKLQNPFALHNMLQWLIDHGPRILGIIVAMFLFSWITRLVDQHIVRLLVRHGDHGTRKEREDRANTLASVFRNFANVVIIAGGILMILAEMQLNIVPLMGGVAVVGMAVAFGAQSLIKDYFYGFMILLENQYGINDVVKIGDTAGLVERITLRVTILRDLQGTVHFVPHGNATVVSNLTHGWARAVVDLGIAYKEDVDQVMQIIKEEGQLLRADPEFGQLTLDDVEVLGVEGFADSAVIIKFMIKVRAMQQWTIKREMLRRLKRRFDEAGIEIPFPQRVVYHRDSAGKHLPQIPEQGNDFPMGN